MDPQWWMWISTGLWIWVVIIPCVRRFGVIGGALFSILPTILFWVLSMGLMLFVGVFVEIQEQQAIEDEQELISPSPKGTFYEDPADMLRQYQ